MGAKNVRYEKNNKYRLGKIMNDPEYLRLNKVEREDIIGYNMFSGKSNRLLWTLLRGG